MSSSVAALPPSHHPIQHKPEYDGAPDVPEIAFSDLWQDKEKGFSFGDFLDIINPLQHIPVVSSIYRMVTEDDIGPGARAAGGALFGGPVGLIGAGLTAIFEEASGGSIEQHMATLWENVTGDDTPAIQVAARQSPAQPEAAAPASAEALPENDVMAYADDADTPEPAAPAPPAAINAQVASAAAVPVAPVPVSPQPLPRPPVSVAPMAAVHRTQAAATEQTRPDPAAERQRIAQSIERARQAQAGLLLANVGENSLSSPEPREENAAESAPAKPQHQPFRPHPYLLPRGAPPELVSRAMEQALAKYQATLQQRQAPATAAAPVVPPATIR